MKKIIVLIGLCFALVLQTFASTLIYKSTKEIKAEKPIVFGMPDFTTSELLTFDSSKYKKIRILVSTNNQKGFIRIYSIEGEDKILLGITDNTILIDTPPNKIMIEGQGVGVYKVYIYTPE